MVSCFDVGAIDEILETSFCTVSFIDYICHAGKMLFQFVYFKNDLCFLKFNMNLNTFQKWRHETIHEYQVIVPEEHLELDCVAGCFYATVHGLQETTDVTP